MSQESPRESTGGLAYEITLKPATSDPRPGSPPKEKMMRLTQDDIEKKLHDAEERRRANQQEALAFVAKDQQRIQTAQVQRTEEEERFRKTAEEKLKKDLIEKEKNREAYINGLLNKLQEHEKRVQSVRLANEEYIKKLQERISQKLTNAETNRQQQLESLRKKLEEHTRSLEEGRRTAAEENRKFSKETEQKILEKMEQTLKNREQQLSGVMEKLKEHERHIEEVRKNKQAAGDS